VNVVGDHIEGYPCDEDGNPIVPLDRTIDTSARARIIELANMVEPEFKRQRIRALATILAENIYDKKTTPEILAGIWNLEPQTIRNDVHTAATLNRALADDDQAIHEFWRDNLEQREQARRIVDLTAKHVETVLEERAPGELKPGALRDLSQAFATANDALTRPVELAAKAAGLLGGDKVTVQVATIMQSPEVQAAQDRWIDAAISAACECCQESVARAIAAAMGVESEEV
jgi:hypothetical protein